MLFSQAEVPLIVDALPMLFQIRDSLKAASLDQPQNDDDDDDSSFTSGETPAVIRIAAYAGMLLIEKYMDLTWDCEIYLIALGNVQFILFYAFTNIYNSYVPRSEANLVEIPS